VKLVLTVLVAAIALAAPAAAAAPAAGAADAVMPVLYENCTNFNKRYRHGVGRAGARDKTSGVPVSTFLRSTRIYSLAMSHNKGLDRDKDLIACETA
jgi:hypothetical protein